MLAGCLIGDNDNLQDVGIFRVTGSDQKIRELEIHLSQGNFNFLRSKPDSHTITNYWKRLLRSMKDPLIPYNFYDEFLWEADIERERSEFNNPNVKLIFTLLKLKFWINKLPQIHFDTLKFHINVFKMIVKHEPLNKMTAYNVAITVGPNIFRPRRTRPEDITNVGSYYELIIQMIQQYDILFNREQDYIEIIQNSKDDNGQFLSSNLNADIGVGISNLDKLK